MTTLLSSLQQDVIPAIEDVQKDREGFVTYTRNLIIENGQGILDYKAALDELEGCIDNSLIANNLLEYAIDLTNYIEKRITEPRRKYEGEDLVIKNVIGDFEGITNEIKNLSAKFSGRPEDQPQGLELSDKELEGLQAVSTIMKEIENDLDAEYHGQDLKVDEGDLLGLETQFERIVFKLDALINQGYVSIEELVKAANHLYEIPRNTCEAHITEANLVVDEVTFNTQGLSEQIEKLKAKIEEGLKLGKEEFPYLPFVVYTFEAPQEDSGNTVDAIAYKSDKDALVANYVTTTFAEFSVFKEIDIPDEVDINKANHNYEGFTFFSPQQSYPTCAICINPYIERPTRQGTLYSFKYQYYVRGTYDDNNPLYYYANIEQFFESLIHFTVTTGNNASVDTICPEKNYSPKGQENTIEKIEAGKYKVILKGVDFPGACFIQAYETDRGDIARVTHWEQQDGDTHVYVEGYSVKELTSLRSRIRKLHDIDFMIAFIGDEKVITSAIPNAKVALYSNAGDNTLNRGVSINNFDFHFPEFKEDAKTYYTLVQVHKGNINQFSIPVPFFWRRKPNQVTIAPYNYEHDSDHANLKYSVLSFQVD